MSNLEKIQIGEYIIQIAKQKQKSRRYENTITFKQICDRFNATMNFIKVNSKAIAEWLKTHIDVIDIDVYEDDTFDIIVKG